MPAASCATERQRRPGILRRLDPSATPLRISDLPWWEREHNGEVSQAAWGKAGSIANCAACHRGAEKGSFEDD